MKDMADNVKVNGSSRVVPTIDEVKTLMADVRRVSVTEAKPGSSKALNNVEQLDALLANWEGQSVYTMKAHKHLRALLKGAGEPYCKFSDQQILDFVGNDGLALAINAEWDHVAALAGMIRAKLGATLPVPSTKVLTERERICNEMNAAAERGEKERVQELSRMLLDLIE